MCIWPVLSRGEVRLLIVKQLLIKCYRLFSLHMYNVCMGRWRIDIHIAPSHTTTSTVCVCVCVCVRACMRACMHACVCIMCCSRLPGHDMCVLITTLFSINFVPFHYIVLFLFLGNPYVVLCILI